jgi:iron complex outermembrane receptor protein
MRVMRGMRAGRYTVRAVRGERTLPLLIVAVLALAPLGSARAADPDPARKVTAPSDAEEAAPPSGEPASSEDALPPEKTAPPEANLEASEEAEAEADAAAEAAEPPGGAEAEAEEAEPTAAEEVRAQEEAESKQRLEELFGPDPSELSLGDAQREFDSRIEFSPDAPMTFVQLGSDLRDLRASPIVRNGRGLARLRFDSASGGNDGPATVMVRGAGQDSAATNFEPGLQTYVDDVFLPFTTGSLLSLIDYDIEVLRGPQPNRGGVTGIGGSVRVRATRPQPELGAGTSVSVGNLGTLRTQTTLNIPLSLGALKERAFTRFSFSTRRDDGFVENVTDGKKAGDDDLLGGRAALRLLPTENSEVNLSFDLSRQDQTLIQGQCRDVLPQADNRAQLDRAFNFGQRCGLAARLGPDRVLSDGLRGVETVEKGAIASIDIELGDWLLSSTSAWRSLDIDTGAGDLDNTDARIVFANDAQSRRDAYSQEFKLSGSLFDERLQLLTGVQYFEDRGESSGGQMRFDGANQAQGMLSSFTDDTKLTSYAGYMNGALALTDRLTLGAGVRYTVEKKDDESLTSERDGNAQPQPGLSSNTQRFAEVSPSADLSYRLSDNVTLSGRYARGFSGAAVAPGQDDPEILDSYEVALRSNWLDDRFLFNVVGYQSVYDNIQINASTAGLALRDEEPIRISTAKGKIRGVDLDFQTSWETRIGALDFGGGMGFIDAEYDEFRADLFDDSADPDPNQPNTQLAAGAGLSALMQTRRITAANPGGVPRELIGSSFDASRTRLLGANGPRTAAAGTVLPSATIRSSSLAGLEFSQTPRFSYNLFMRYQLDMVERGSLTAVTTWYQQDKTSLNLFNTVTEDSFGVLDFSLSWDSPSGRFLLGAYVNNVLDKRYLEGASESQDFDGAEGVFFSRPRTYGVQIGYRFGGI